MSYCAASPTGMMPSCGARSSPPSAASPPSPLQKAPSPPVVDRTTAPSPLLSMATPPPLPLASRRTAVLPSSDLTATLSLRGATSAALQPLPLALSPPPASAAAVAALAAPP
ncbi:hypothetical protein Vafri_6523, partial [Volvox africanus]